MGGDRLELSTFRLSNEHSTIELHARVGVEGFEPSRGGSKDRCLTPWRHPRFNLDLSALGLEPRTDGLKGRHSTIELCALYFALWGDRTLVPTVKRWCPTIRRRELEFISNFGWGEPDSNRRGFLDRFTVCCFQPLSHRPVLEYGQLLGIEPRAIEPQSTILPLNYSCRTHCRTWTGTPQKQLLRLPRLPFRQVGNKIKTELYPEGDSNSQKPDPKSGTSTNSVIEAIILLYTPCRTWTGKLQILSLTCLPFH